MRESPFCCGSDGDLHDCTVAARLQALRQSPAVYPPNFFFFSTDARSLALFALFAVTTSLRRRLSLFATSPSSDVILPPPISHPHPLSPGEAFRWPLHVFARLLVTSFVCRTRWLKRQRPTRTGHIACGKSAGPHSLPPRTSIIVVIVCITLTTSRPHQPRSSLCLEPAHKLPAHWARLRLASRVTFKQHQSSSHHRQVIQLSRRASCELSFPPLCRRHAR